MGAHVFWDLVSRDSQPLFDPLTVEHEDVRHDGRQNERNDDEHHSQDDPCVFGVLFWKTQESSHGNKVGENLNRTKTNSPH